MMERLKTWNWWIEDAALDHPYLFWGAFSLGVLLLGWVTGDLHTWSAVAAGMFTSLALLGGKQRREQRSQRALKRADVRGAAEPW